MPQVTPKLKKHLGRKPDPPDKRDRYLPLMPHLGVAAPLPSSVDVFSGLSLPVYDQGELGSCTANAGVLYRRFLAQKFSKYSAPDQDLSRIFLYYQERKLDGDLSQDDGAAVRDVFRVLASTGVCPESLCSYIISDFSEESHCDTSVEIGEAGAYKIGAYHRVPDLRTAKSVLASSYPVVLGFTVYGSFEDIGGEGVMPMPKAGESVIGGHAVVIRGYDDGLKCGPSGEGAFFVQNSWGLGWGSGGCFWMPYPFLQNTDLSQPDMWVGHLGKPWA